jgi:hypothetical protein
MPPRNSWGASGIASSRQLGERASGRISERAILEQAYKSGVSHLFPAFTRGPGDPGVFPCPKRAI